MTEQDLVALIQGALDAAHEQPGTAHVTIDSEFGDDGWDSLTHLSVLTTLDKHFEGGFGHLPGVDMAFSVRAIHAVLVRHGLIG